MRKAQIAHHTSLGRSGGRPASLCKFLAGVRAGLGGSGRSSLSHFRAFFLRLARKAPIPITLVFFPRPARPATVFDDRLSIRVPTCIHLSFSLSLSLPYSGTGARREADGLPEYTCPAATTLPSDDVCHPARHYNAGLLLRPR